MDPVFLAELRLFAGNFAPVGWALCAGQTLAINTNVALFALLGTTYGGNGTSTFQLPNLQSRVAIAAGQGNGLSMYNLGQTGGTESITLTTSNLPTHNHVLTGTVNLPATAAAGDTDTPYNTYPAKVTGTSVYGASGDGSTIAMQHNLTTASTGNTQPVSLIQPVLGLT